MIIRNTFKAAALASVCLVPLAAAAQAQDDTGFDLPEAMPNTQELKRVSAQSAETYDNEATIGLRGTSSTSADFGRYNGQYGMGAAVTGDWRLQSRQDWKSGGTYYYNFTGSDLNFGTNQNFQLAPNSTVNLKVGNQGSWGLTVGWDAMSFVQSNNYTSVFDKNGAIVNGAPGSAGYAVSSAASTTFAAHNAPYAVQNLVGTRRDKGSVDLNGQFGNWKLSTGLTHEHKEGTIGSSMEMGGSNSSFAAIILPINYDTDRYDLTAAYNTDKSQTIVKYAFSNFRENNPFFHYANFNTFSSSAGGNVTTHNGYFSEAPSNMAHSLSIQTAYNLSDVTRLNANLQYGLQLQNDGFVPMTGTPSNSLGGGGRWTNAFANPTNLNGIVHTVFGNVGFTTRPFDKADLKANYTIDGRLNNTKPQFVAGDVGDSVSSAATAFSTTSRWAVAPSWVKQTAGVEGGYRILPSTRVGLGYTYRQENRTESITATTNENELSANARTAFSSDLVGNLKYSYSRREASAPNYYAWTRYYPDGDCAGIALAGSPNLISCFQIPFYEAGRTKHAVQGRMTETLTDAVSVSMFGKFDNSQYGSTYGVKHEYNYSGGPDIAYHISPDADANFFYTYKRSFRSQASSGDWQEATTGDTHSTGINGKWKISDTVKLGASYTFTYGSEAIQQSGYFPDSTSLQGDPSLPLVTSMNNSFKINGEYEYVPGVTLFMGYGFDRLITSDWALFGNNPTGWAAAGGTGSGTAPQLSSGQVNPNYAVHSVITRVSFKW